VYDLSLRVGEKRPFGSRRTRRAATTLATSRRSCCRRHRACPRRSIRGSWTPVI